MHYLNFSYEACKRKNEKYLFLLKPASKIRPTLATFSCTFKTDELILILE